MVRAGSLQAYQAATSGVGLIDRSHLGRIVVSGDDRASYLQGLLTNDVAALAPGQGCYAAYLTAQGRMIADLHVFELGGLILLTMIRDVKDTVLGRLEQFVFTEDVKLGDVSDTFAEWAVVGPGAAAALAAALSGASADALAALPDHGSTRAAFGGEPAIVVVPADAGVRGFDVLVDRAAGPALGEALRRAGAVDVDADTADVIRIEAGLPRFHGDMDESTIPLEAGIEGRAISFTKGCYVGQEIVIRVMHRGHGRVAKRLVGLLGNAGSELPAHAPISLDGREVGAVTSAALSPALGRPIALGYLQRDAAETGTAVSVAGTSATVAPLPFVARGI